MGCGDSFAAAILLGYVGAHDIMPTLVLANAVGAATAMGRGAGRNVATAARVQVCVQSRHPGGTARLQHPRPRVGAWLAKPCQSRGGWGAARCRVHTPGQLRHGLAPACLHAARSLGLGCSTPLMPASTVFSARRVCWKGPSEPAGMTPGT